MVKNKSFAVLAPELQILNRLKYSQCVYIYCVRIYLVMHFEENCFIGSTEGVFKC